jgi:hypothetical protein
MEGVYLKKLTGLLPNRDGGLASRFTSTRVLHGIGQLHVGAYAIGGRAGILFYFPTGSGLSRQAPSPMLTNSGKRRWILRKSVMPVTGSHRE